MDMRLPCVRGCSMRSGAGLESFSMRALAGPPCCGRQWAQRTLRVVCRYMLHMRAALEACPEIDADSKQRLHDYFRCVLWGVRTVMKRGRQVVGLVRRGRAGLYDTRTHVAGFGQQGDLRMQRCRTKPARVWR